MELLRLVFFTLVVKPFALLWLGVNVRHGERLPLRGPAVLAPNHNSNLDGPVLMSLYPIGALRRVRPVGAVDYWLRNRVLRWVTLDLMGMIPISRAPKASGGDPLAGCAEAIGRGDVLILFPEGTRGDPEVLGTLRSGIAHLAQRYPDLPIYPVFMHGLGKALPRGEALLVPFICDIHIGEPVRWTGDRATFMATLQASLEALVAEGHYPAWR